MADKRHILTYAGLKQYEDGPQNLRVVEREKVAQKTKEAREQSDLSENAEYDATRDERRDIGLRIKEPEGLLKNVGVVVENEINLDKINTGCKIKLLDMGYGGKMESYIVGFTEVSSLQNKISNGSPVGRALISKVMGDYVGMETWTGDIQYKMLEIQRVS